MLNAFDRALIKATQGGLPLEPDPYGAVGRDLGVSGEIVMARLRELLARGAIRRIGLIPNHYRLGVTANGMSVWDVDDAVVAEIGARVGALPFVTHCYRRPRHPPDWRYNLFAMVHGRTREEARARAGEIALLIGPAARAHDILFSTRILKKTGLRLAG
jgi:DNA-binding Lrp family transcriptional regulator